MASLVERLRTRSERRPLYSLDDSDDEASLVRGKSMAAQEKLERIVRPDSVRFCSSSDFSMHHLLSFIIMNIYAGYILFVCSSVCSITGFSLCIGWKFNLKFDYV